MWWLLQYLALDSIVLIFLSRTAVIASPWQWSCHIVTDVSFWDITKKRETENKKRRKHFLYGVSSSCAVLQNVYVRSLPVVPCGVDSAMNWLSRPSMCRERGSLSVCITEIMVNYNNNSLMRIILIWEWSVSEFCFVLFAVNLISLPLDC